jgi:hypothetical protein
VEIYKVGLVFKAKGGSVLLLRLGMAAAPGGRVLGIWR